MSKIFLAFVIRKEQHVGGILNTIPLLRVGTIVDRVACGM